MSERASGIFSDLHAEHGKVRATLLHDPSVEGLDTAIYMDGSASMVDEYGKPNILHKIWRWLTPRRGEAFTNEVDPQVKRMLQYLATKDRNGRLRVAYWACGNGTGVETVGEFTAADLEHREFVGPSDFGSGTHLAPAVQDFVDYMRQQAREGSRRGCAVIVTDGGLSDAEDVERLNHKIAAQIQAGTLPPLNFVFVGVGSGVDEEQMEEICHEEYGGLEHMWCHRIAAEMSDIAQLVAVLVDETMTINTSGRLLDDRGNVLRSYEGRVPAVLEFDIPPGCRSFVLEIGGQRYEQAIPAEHH